MNNALGDSPWMSAREKRLVLQAWVRFLKRGLRSADFTDRLYRHLHLHCRFIAHYHRAGFYGTYFEQEATVAQFLSQFDRRGECRSVEYGGDGWLQGEYADLNRAMVEEGAAYIPAPIEQAQVTERNADLAHAYALLAKHGQRPDEAS